MEVNNLDEKIALGYFELCKEFKPTIYISRQVSAAVAAQRGVGGVMTTL